jgi:hypothetical protein
MNEGKLGMQKEKMRAKSNKQLVFRNFGLVNYDPELLTELGRKFRVSSAPEFEIQ